MHAHCLSCYTGNVTTIAIVAQKGGAGKTTVAVHLAVAAMTAGERVAIVDLDPQQSALAWSSTRGCDEPTVIAIDGPDLIAALAEAGRDGYTVVIVDTAPRAAPVVAATVRAADFALVPMRPAAFDLATIEQIVAIIAATPTPGALVLNACPSRAPEVAEAREVCTGHAVPLAPMQLGDRRAYARAVQTGRAVQEFEPRGAAAAEISALWTFVNERTTKNGAQKLRN